MSAQLQPPQLQERQLSTLGPLADILRVLYRYLRQQADALNAGPLASTEYTVEVQAGQAGGVTVLGVSTKPASVRLVEVVDAAGGALAAAPFLASWKFDGGVLRVALGGLDAAKRYNATVEVR